MRLLVVSPFLPSEHPRHGGEKLLFEMLEHLSRRHEVALAALVQPDLPPGVIGRMKTMLPVVETVRKDVFRLPRIRRARNLFSLTPARFLQTASQEMESRIRRLVEAFDPHTVQVEFLAMAEMGSRIPHPVVVLDSHEAFGRAWSCRAMARGPGPGACLELWEAVRLMRMEAKVLARFRTVLAFSREDRDFFLSRSPNASVHIWTPGGTLPPPPPEERTPGREEPGLLFVGAFRHPPNVEGIRYFCRQVLPLIVRQHPGVLLNVVGPDPPPSVRALASPNVRIHGYVKDLDGLYAKRPVFVSPILRGGGIRMKNLEALGRAIAVVTTRQGAEGIDAVHGEHWFVAGDPRDFAACTCRLLADPALRARTGRAARRWVAEHHHWPDAVERLTRIHQDLVGPIVTVP